MIQFSLPAKRSVIDLAMPGRLPRNRCPCRTAFTITEFGNFRNANAQLIGKFKIFIPIKFHSGYFQYFQSECAIWRWHFSFVPLPGLSFTFTKCHISICTPRITSVREREGGGWEPYTILQPTLSSETMIHDSILRGCVSCASFICSCLLMMHQFLLYR